MCKPRCLQIHIFQYYFDLCALRLLQIYYDELMIRAKIPQCDLLKVTGIYRVKAYNKCIELDVFDVQTWLS